MLFFLSKHFSNYFTSGFKTFKVFFVVPVGIDTVFFNLCGYLFFLHKYDVSCTLLTGTSQLATFQKITADMNSPSWLQSYWYLSQYCGLCLNTSF